MSRNTSKCSVSRFAQLFVILMGTLASGNLLATPAIGQSDLVETVKPTTDSPDLIAKRGYIGFWVMRSPLRNGGMFYETLTINSDGTVIQSLGFWDQDKTSHKLRSLTRTSNEFWHIQDGEIWISIDDRKKFISCFPALYSGVLSADKQTLKILNYPHMKFVRVQELPDFNKMKQEFIDKIKPGLIDASPVPQPLPSESPGSPP